MSAAALGCNLNNPGDDPPRALLYFPNTMALSKAEGAEPPRYLFVGNSDFDLRYRSGTVQAYSLERIAARANQCRRKPSCAIDDLAQRDRSGLVREYPVAPHASWARLCRRDPECEIDDPSSYMEAEVRIKPFVTAIGLSSDGRYLFAATRTDGKLVFMHADTSANNDRVLTCPDNAERRCGLQADDGEIVDDDQGNPATWPENPEALIAGPLADWMPTTSTPTDAQYILVAHRGGGTALGAASLFVLQPKNGTRPETLTSTGVLPGVVPGAAQVNYDPVTRLIYMPLAPLGAASPNKLLARIGIEVPVDADGTAQIEHALPYDAGYIQLDGVASAYSDTRDVAFLPGLVGAGATAGEDRALIVAQEPSALLLTDINPQRNQPGLARVLQTTVVGRGATRLVVGNFDGHLFAVVGSFLSRELDVIDLESMQVRAVIPNLSGPFALTLDVPRKLVYAADFRSSVIRVVDLAPLFDPTAEDDDVRVVLTLGKPRVLQELR